jgi:hypothetical protein
MDLYCPRCGEPWDFDSLHDEAQARYGVPFYIDEDRYASLKARVKNPAYNEDEYGGIFKSVQKEFRQIGCEAMRVGFGAKCSTPSTGVDRGFGLTRQDAASALYEVLGDDMDGAAAMLEDMGF